MVFRGVSERSERGKDGRGAASLSHRTALSPGAHNGRPIPRSGRYDGRHMVDALSGGRALGLFSAAALLVGLVASARPAAAQEEPPPVPEDPLRVREGDPLRAQQLFDEALALSDQNRWSEACPKFRESLAADPGVGTLLNVASCSAREGKVLEAVREYKQAQQLNATTKDPERKRVVDGQIKQALKDLSARYGRVALKIAPADARSRVTIDGVLQKEASADGIDLLIGDHTVVVEAEGFVRHEAKISIVGGQDAAVPIGLEAVKKPAPPPPPARTRASALSTAGWITGLVGAGGLAGGAALLVFAADRAAAIRDECGPLLAPPSCPGGSTERANELAQEGKAYATGGYVLLGVGGAALATGIVLLVIDATTGQPAPVEVSLSVAPGAIGARLGGTFQ